MNALMMDFSDRYNHDASINKRGLGADLANFYDMHQIECMKLLAYEQGVPISSKKYTTPFSYVTRHAESKNARKFSKLSSHHDNW